ncbi:hypothetical protein D3C76_965030 [compost metagenome]
MHIRLETRTFQIRRKQLLRRHNLAVAVVIGDDLLRMTQSADDASRLPDLLGSTLNHDAKIESALIISQQFNALLDQVSAFQLMLTDRSVQFVDRTEGTNGFIELELISFLPLVGLEFNPHDSFSPGSVHGLDVDHFIFH